MTISAHSAFSSPVPLLGGLRALHGTSVAVCPQSGGSLRLPRAARPRSEAEPPSPVPSPSPSSPSPSSPQSSSSLQVPRRRETDPRGFVVPVPGDVVTFAGRWPGEDAAGLVEQVRYVAARRASVVDLVELRSVGPALYAPSRRRRWCDVADVSLASDAVYVPNQDAYRVESVRTGFARVRPLDPESKARADEEYMTLKQKMLRVTAASAFAGTIVCFAIGGKDVSFAYSLGAAASILYLLMLQSTVDAVGEVARTTELPTDVDGSEAVQGIAEGLNGLATRLLLVRFIVPVIPFAVLSILASAHGTIQEIPSHGFGFSSILGSLSRSQVAAIVGGLLTYKVPIILQTASEAVDTIAEADIGTGSTGMLGAAATLAARTVKRRAGGKTSDSQDNPSEKPEEPVVVVIAGPSGVGKTSLLRRLFQEFPGVFEFSVSHTTRHPREGEVDGVAYNFVDKVTFEAMIEADEFVEYAQVYGNYYGTSYQSIDKVLASEKLCILDLDVQGVKALATRPKLKWTPRFVWIAPPSIHALEQRLRRRGSESEEALASRLDAAMREMTFAATSNAFDITIVNQNFDEAYLELQAFIASVLQLKS
jgi:guanylate kinase